MQLRNILLVIKRDLSKTYRYISDNAEIKLKTMFQQVDWSQLRRDGSQLAT